MWLTIAVCGVHTLAAFFWIGALQRSVKDAPLGRIFWPALVYKVAMGWLLGYTFMVYYQQGDTLNYFRDAQELAKLAYQQPGAYLRVLSGEEEADGLIYADRPRALFFAKVVSLINVVTYNNYWLSAAYLSFISFWSSWLLANDLGQRFQRKWSAAGAFLFYPSVVFWGAGILKESLAVATITLIVWLALRLLSGDYPGRLWIVMLLLMLTTGLLWRVKYYYAGVLLPTLISVAVARVLGTPQRPSRTITIFFGSLLVLMSAGGLLHPRLQLTSLAQTLVDNHDTMVRLSHGKNIIEFSNLDPGYESLLSNLPMALASGLFRPLAGEVSTVLGWVVGIENTLLLLLAGGAAVNGWRTGVGRKHTLWVVAALTYTGLLASLLAFASPNFGSLMRYKVSFLPFLAFLCLAGNQKIGSKR